MLAEAGAAGCSIEDFTPSTDRIEDVEVAAARVAERHLRRTRRRSRSC